MEVVATTIGAVAGSLAILGALGAVVRYLWGRLGRKKDPQEPPPPPPPAGPIESSQPAPPAREVAPGVTYWLGRPPSLGDGFVGRETELKDLTEAFEGHEATIVSGGAGTGKSRLAAEYAHQCGLDGFWSDAGATVAQTLAALAPALEVEVEASSDEEIAAQVQKVLAGLGADALWVVDNLADLGLVSDLLSAAGPVRLLITTRDGRKQLLPPQVAFHPLETLAPDPAIVLLCSRSDSDRKDAALPEIAEAVGWLPLALEMLAVRLGEPLQTPERLLAELREAPTPIELEAFEEAAGATIATKGVFKTITGTLASLPKKARQQIAPLGYLADAPIPEALLAALTDLDEEGLSRLLDRCSRQSILIVREDQVVVHALTTAAIAATNDDAAITTAVERAGPRLADICLADPIALRAELAHHDQIRSRAKQPIGQQDLSFLSFADSVGVGFVTAGRAGEAVHVHEETLAVMKGVLGPDHPGTLASRNNLAIGYRAAGRTEEAIRLDEETLAARERVLGPDDADTLASRNGLAIGYRAAGRLEEAIRLDEETLVAFERVLGPDHPSTLASRNGLANGYRADGRMPEAIRLYEETLAAKERLLGPEHPDTLISRANLASGYLAAGRVEEAVRLYGETLAAMERVLGPDHPNTLQSRNNLLLTYRAVGRDEEADRLEGKAAPD